MHASAPQIKAIESCSMLAMPEPTQSLENNQESCAHPAAGCEDGHLEQLAHLVQELLQEGAPLKGGACSISGHEDLLDTLQRSHVPALSAGDTFP